ncbi:N-acetylmuramoyl-L-alanine amidase [bacterium]|nr:N-acetylmuramoyl-L-alanine amidase [bacterium]
MYWSASTGATGYGLYVSDVSTGNLVYDNDYVSNVTHLTLPSGTLQAGRAYRWNMRAKNSAGWGSYSSRFYFQTQGVVPSPPTLSSPGSSSSPGPQISSLTPTMQWSASSGATGYGLYVEDVATAALVYDNDNLANVTQLTLPGGTLQAGRAYKWNMRAKNSAGWSNFSSRLYFQTQGVVPPPPVLGSPGTAASPGPILTTLIPSMKWSASSGATGYGLYVEDVATAALVYDNDNVANVTQLTLPLGTLQARRAYKWNMRAKNSAGWSNFSSRLYFQAPAEVLVGGFDFPVGKPDGSGYNHTVGWDFLEWTDGQNNPVFHPGEDWNGNGGGDSDLGDPVYAAGDGIVTASADYQGGWGNIIVIRHELSGGGNVWTQYAHLQTRMKSVGNTVVRGDQIGTIGKGYNNQYWAHLHFEVRKTDRAPDAYVTGLTKAQVAALYYCPTDFINAHRPASQTSPLPPTLVSPGTATSPGSQITTLTPTMKWSASTGATGYGLYVRDINTNVLVVDNDNVSNVTQLTLGAPLVNGHRYKWNMRAKNASGWSAFTLPYYFTIADTSSVDYPGATWVPAANENITVGRPEGECLWIVLHTTEGTADSAIQRFQNGDDPDHASAHYIIRMDGSIIQLVRERDTAHHAGNYPYNKRSIGIEHERYGTNNITDAQYISSAALVKNIAQRHGISLVFPAGVQPADPSAGQGIIGHLQVPDPTNPAYGGGLYHKVDPQSQYWNWAYYKGLFTNQLTVNSFAINNGSPSTTNPVVTLNNTCTGGPTHYMASESSSFSGATWKTYATAPTFSLSPTIGTKRVYFKVKNATQESAVGYDDIGLGSGDQWDPTDDTWAHPTPLSPPTSTQQSHAGHTLSATDLYDWFQISLTAGVKVNFNSIDGSGDDYVEIISATGAGCLASDDNTGGSGQFSVTFTPLVTGNYWVRVRGARLGNVCSYDLKYNTVTIPSGRDGWDPTDDSWATPNILPAVAASDQTFGQFTLSSTDRYDWFKARLNAGTRYYFYTTGTGDNYMELMNYSTGICVSYDDNSAGGGQAGLTFTPLVSGQYLLRIRAKTLGNTCAYYLKCHTITPGAGEDAWDPKDNTFAFANLLPDPTTTEQTFGLFTLSTIDRYDWFKVKLTAGVPVRFESISGTANTYGTLFNYSTGQIVAQDDNDGEGIHFLIDYTPPVTGYYMLRVHEYYTRNRSYYLRCWRTTSALSPAGERSAAHSDWLRHE